MPEIAVKLRERGYKVEIGGNNTAALRRSIKRHLGDGRLFVFFDAQFYALHGSSLRAKLKFPSKRWREMVIPTGEKAKSSVVLQRLYDYLLDEKISRTDLILACGGGVTTDLVGYTAATALRGIRWGAVSTTLLGMVDASIGGKTGINHRTGKNLIGAFWQPSFVHCDIRYLQTLSRRQMVAGLGEVLKYGGLIGKKMIDPLAAYLDASDLYREKALASLVTLSVQYKADIVSRDERESGVRMFLNYGHTFGHAIERALGYGRLLHGEAIILGILAALELGELMNGPARSLAEYHRIVEVLVKLVPRRRIAKDEVLQAMRLDKKRQGADLKYILLDRPGRPYVASSVTQRLSGVAIKRMLEFYENLGGKYADDFGR